MKSSGKKSLAVFGGSPVLNYKDLLKHNPIGEQSIALGLQVLQTGRLSEFIGEWSEDFYGGPMVKQLEAACIEFFNTRFAVTVNSWTSGLVAAIGAIGVEPGDEVITTPYTMAATATSILHWNAIPVFVDIDPRTFNIDTTKIESNISERTKAILAVDIYGQPADMDEIKAIAQKYNLKVIADSAQSPGALYKGKFAGTISDIGGYSFNFHKHIHSGEGGVCFTEDPELAINMQLIRNHAEAVVATRGHKDFINMLGHNFRMGELEAAILLPQIYDLQKFVLRRSYIAEKLNQGLSKLPGLTIPYVAENRTHAYYGYSVQIPTFADSGIKRALIVEALQKEGVPVSGGYQNLHLLPMYQKKIAYGSKGFPWFGLPGVRDINYSKGICPVAESMHEEKVIGLGLATYDFTDNQVDQIIEAFEKVWDHYFA